MNVPMSFLHKSGYFLILQTKPARSNHAVMGGHVRKQEMRKNRSGAAASRRISETSTSCAVICLAS